MDTDKPITTEDLYGGSNSGSSEVAPGVVVEETPIIEPIVDFPEPQIEVELPEISPPKPLPEIAPIEYKELPTRVSQKPSATGGNKLTNSIGSGIFFLALFFLGIWLSTWVRQFLPTGIVPGLTGPTPTQTPLFEQLTPSPAKATWKSYQVISGVTKQSIPGLSLELPVEVLVPICDGGSCASQGTYLPGGTRLTIAPRGKGEALADFRGKLISEVGGKTFTAQEVQLGDWKAQEFTASFSGSTVGGYSFNRMRGYMIELSDSLSLEINHFTPQGINAEFDSDDGLFDQIVKTIIFSPATAK